MIRYGIWCVSASDWCNGYYFTPKSKPEDNKGRTQFFDINEAYKELSRWQYDIEPKYYEIREVE